MLRGTLLTHQFNNAASEANMNNSLVGMEGGGGGGKRGRMDCYRSRGKAVKALRRAAFTWKFRTHLAKRAFRPVSSRFRFERRGFTATCIKADPSNQLRETSLASLLGKLHLPVPYAAFFIPIFLPLCLPHPLQLFSLSIFVLSRPINSQPDTSFRLALHCYGRSF